MLHLCHPLLSPKAAPRAAPTKLPFEAIPILILFSPSGPMPGISLSTSRAIVSKYGYFCQSEPVTPISIKGRGVVCVTPEAFFEPGL